MRVWFKHGEEASEGCTRLVGVHISAAAILQVWDVVVQFIKTMSQVRCEMVHVHLDDQSKFLDVACCYMLQCGAVALADCNRQAWMVDIRPAAKLHASMLLCLSGLCSRHSRINLSVLRSGIC